MKIVWEGITPKCSNCGHEPEPVNPRWPEGPWVCPNCRQTDEENPGER